MPQKLNSGQLTNFPKSTKATFLTGTPDQEALTPKAIFDAAASITLASATNLALVFTSGLNWDVVLTSNTTLANPSGLIPGQSGRIRVQQDSSGSRTMAYGTYWRFPGGAPTLSTAANAVDVIAFYVHTASIIECSFLRGLA